MSSVLFPVRTAEGKVDRVGSFFDLPSLYKELELAGYVAVTPGDLGPLFLRQNDVLLTWLERAAEELAPALVAGELFVDPEIIVFGGSWPAPLIDYLLEQLAARLPDLRIAQKAYEPRLVHAEAGEDAAALGVAILPIYDSLVPHPKLLEKNGRSPPLQNPALAERR